MSIEISNTKLFDEKEQPAEILPETESNYQTHLSPAHVNYINTNLLHDNHTPLPSPSLIQRNTKDPINEPSKLKISEQITMELFKDFRLFLDKRTKHETTAHNQERDKNTRPLLTQATDIQKNNAQTYGHTAAN